jgi:hypothetical protein
MCVNDGQWPDLTELIDCRPVDDIAIVLAQPDPAGFGYNFRVNGITGSF